MYQALYRKYRPQSFDDVVGQTAVTTTLKNQLITGRMSHAYLFTGSHGTGKTTCAKILAKAVNCENPVDGNPCNRCPACRGIDAGSILDVQEIDAASNNGVDNVRAIRDDAVYPPAEVKKRVYIIDEVHMLSTAAFNALLKTIEEPPEHLMFILATTELNKVPATILSRCQRFAFRRPTPEDITGRINYVAYQEGIGILPEAAELLGRLADGAFRDGLSLLDQCASATPGKLGVEDVYQTLGLAGQQQTEKLMEAIGERNTPRVLKIYSDLYGEGKDISAMFNELSTLARDLLVLKTAPDSGLGMISSTCTAGEMKGLLPKFTPEELLRMIELIQTTVGGFKNSVNPRLDGELCLIYLCRPEIGSDSRDLTARLSRVEEDLTQKLLELEGRLKSGHFVAAPQQEEPWDDAPPPWEDGDIPPEGSEREEPVQPQEPQIQEPQTDETWLQILQRTLPDLSPMVRSIVEENISGRVAGDELRLTVKTDFARDMLKRSPDTLDKLRKKATVVLGKAVRVRMVDGQGDHRDDLFSQLVGDLDGLDHVTIINS